MAEIRNPNQQGGQKNDSRSLLAFSLVFLVMLLALQYFRKKPEPAPAHHKQQQQAAAPVSNADNSAAAPQTAASDTAPTTGPAAAAAVSVVSQGEQTTTVENELYRIVFTNRGAQVKSWVLKRHTDDAQQRPLELVNAETAAKFGYPLSLYSYDAGLRQRLASALYVPSSIGNIAAPGELTFDYASGGLVVKKTFRFDASYVVHVTASVMNNGSALPTLLSWPPGLGDQNSLAAFASAQFDTSASGKFEKRAP